MSDNLVDPVVIERLQRATELLMPSVVYDRDGMRWRIISVKDIMVAVADNGRYVWEEKPDQFEVRQRAI